MNLNSPRFWVGFFSTTGVFLLVIRDAGKIDPGPLSEVHDRVSELTERDGCVLCHGSGATTMSDGCLECHEVIGEQLDADSGLHGVLDERVAIGCALCHGEHHGEGFALINARSFALAGSPEEGFFDHGLIGVTMYGKHLEQECSKCHENADVEVLEEGTTRFLGLDRSCVSCHEDPHEGRMSRSCADCHGQESFQDLAEFTHDERFPLEGSHAGVGCLECHQPDAGHSVEELDSMDHVESVRRCADCHESPHSEPFVRRVAGSEGTAPLDSCTTCHAVEHEGFAGIGLEITAEQHACSGFPLDAPHEEVSCDDCHAARGETFAERYPGRGRDDCASCHEDVHEGQFAEGPFSGGCLECHSRLHFEPHEFGPERHERARLSLSGGHADLDCTECHAEPEADVVRVFADAEHRCESCHDDGHDGFFAPFARALPADPAGDCARCHRVTSFDDVPASHFDHGFWTGFGVHGAHAQNSCETCHPRASVADATGRTFGWASERFGPVEGCASCHVDPHDGAFDAPDLPRRVDDRTGCARCHVETSFRAHEDGFDHGRWTGFDLAGAHGEVSCSGCHEPLVAPRADGRSFAAAVGTECADCHGYPHAGQFRVDGDTDCRRCHQSTAHAFADLVFDHDRDSRFPLEDAHRELECSACHRPWRLADGAEVVRYRPLGTDCADCHGSSEGGNARRRGRGR